MGDDMIPIYLCEDNALQLDLLKSMIEKYIFIQAYDMEIRQATHTPYELLDLLPDQPENAVYFLDIHLHSDMDGIELASAIRQKDPRAFIIFTTTHSEMAMTTFRYQVEPLGFLIKDDPNYTCRFFTVCRAFSRKVKFRLLRAVGCISGCPIRIYSYQSMKFFISKRPVRTASPSIRRLRSTSAAAP